jgi:hypothetical protein
MKGQRGVDERAKSVDERAKSVDERAKTPSNFRG